MCVFLGGGAAGRRHWGQRTSAGGRKAMRLHAHTSKKIKKNKINYTNMRLYTRSVVDDNTHNYTHCCHLTTHTSENRNAELHTCRHARKPIPHCQRHCHRTSGTVTIATQDWSCHPGLVRWVTARESER